MSEDFKIISVLSNSVNIEKKVKKRLYKNLIYLKQKNFSKVDKIVSEVEVIFIVEDLQVRIQVETLRRSSWVNDGFGSKEKTSND